MNAIENLLMNNASKNEPLELMDINELAEHLRIGKNAAYDLVRSNQIKALRIGRTWRIPIESINEYIRLQSHV